MRCPLQPLLCLCVGRSPASSSVGFGGCSPAQPWLCHSPYTELGWGQRLWALLMTHDGNWGHWGTALEAHELNPIRGNPGWLCSGRKKVFPVHLLTQSSCGTCSGMEPAAAAGPGARLDLGQPGALCVPGGHRIPSWTRTAGEEGKGQKQTRLWHSLPPPSPYTPGVGLGRLLPRFLRKKPRLAGGRG